MPPPRATSPDVFRGIQVVSFDLDDTLFACAPVLAKADASLRAFMGEKHPALKEHLEDHTPLGHYVSLVQLRAPHKNHDVTFIKREAILLACSNAGVDMAAGHECFEHFLRERTAHCSNHFYDGVLSTLRALRDRGLRIGTISNGNANPLAISGLAELVEVHVSAAEANSAKPHSAPFDLLATKLGVPKSAIMHVGDDYRADVLGAKAAGYGRTVWISANKGNDHEADVVIESVALLSELF